MKWIEVRVVKAENDESHQRHGHDQQERQRQLSNDMDTANVEAGHDQEQQKSDTPMLDPRMHGEPILHVVGHGNAVGRTHEEGSGPVPPAALEAPEVAERGATPSIKAAFDWHHGGHFRGSQGNRNREYEWNYDQKSQAESWSGTGDHGFQRKRSACAVGKQQGDQRRQA